MLEFDRYIISLHQHIPRFSKGRRIGAKHGKRV